MMIDSNPSDRRHVRLIPALTLTVLLTACSGMKQGSTRVPSDTIRIEVGELDDISFSNNPSTGYSWMLASLPNGVYLVGVDDVPPTEPRPGAAGTRVFTIGGVRPGKGKLAFVLARPWELQQPAQRVDYEVVVRRRHD